MIYISLKKICVVFFVFVSQAHGMQLVRYLNVSHIPKAYRAHQQDLFFSSNQWCLLQQRISSLKRSSQPFKKNLHDQTAETHYIDEDFMKSLAIKKGLDFVKIKSLILNAKIINNLQEKYRISNKDILYLFGVKNSSKEHSNLAYMDRILIQNIEAVEMQDIERGKNQETKETWYLPIGAFCTFLFMMIYEDNLCARIREIEKAQEKGEVARFLERFSHEASQKSESQRLKGIQ